MTRRLTRKQALEEGIKDIEKVTFTARGNASLTEEEYWELPGSSTAWGVMEIDTDYRRIIQFSAMSIVWGLKSQQEATFLAAFMSRVFQACEPHHAGKKMHVPFSRPPCQVRIPIAGKNGISQELTLDVPEDFPVRYHNDRWMNFGTHFLDDYAETKPRHAGLKEDRAWMIEFNRHVQRVSSLLPNDLWTTHGERVFLHPAEGMDFVPVLRTKQPGKRGEHDEGESGDAEEEEEGGKGGGGDPMDIDKKDSEEEEEEEEESA